MTKNLLKKRNEVWRNAVALTMVLVSAIIDLAILGPMIIGTFKEFLKLF